MAYRCSKCHASWRKKQPAKKLKKTTLHIFDDVGVAACELFILKRIEPRSLVRKVEYYITTTPWGFLRNTDAVHDLSLRVLAERDTHSHGCAVGVFLHIVQIFHTRYTN